MNKTIYLIGIILILFSTASLANLDYGKGNLEVKINNDNFVTNGIETKYDKDVLKIEKKLSKDNKYIFKEIYKKDKKSNENIIPYYLNEKPTHIVKAYYRNHPSIIDCGKDDDCYMQRKDKFYYLFCWGDSFCRNTYSEDENKIYNNGKAGKVYNTIITDYGYYKDLGENVNELIIEQDLDFSIDYINFTNDVTKSDFLDFLQGDGKNCTPLNLSKYKNNSNIPLICFLKFRNNSILNFTKKQESSIGQRGIEFNFLWDYMSGVSDANPPIMVYGNVTGYFGRTTFSLETGTDFGTAIFGEFYKKYTGTHLYFDNTQFINRGVIEAGEILFEIQSNSFENATFKDCYFSYASPTIGGRINNIKLVGGSNVIENTITFPTNIDISDLENLKIRATAEPSSACFSAAFFSTTFSSFSNVNLECKKFSTGIFSGLHLNLTDSIVKISDLTGSFTSGYASAASINYFNTLNYNFKDASNGTLININVTCSNTNNTPLTDNHFFKRIDFNKLSNNISKSFINKRWVGTDIKPVSEFNYTTICNFTDITGNYFSMKNVIMDLSETKTGDIYFTRKTIRGIIWKAGGVIWNFIN